MDNCPSSIIEKVSEGKSKKMAIHKSMWFCYGECEWSNTPRSVTSYINETFRQSFYGNPT